MATIQEGWAARHCMEGAFGIRRGGEDQGGGKAVTEGNSNDCFLT